MTDYRVCHVEVRFANKLLPPAHLDMRETIKVAGRATDPHDPAADVEIMRFFEWIPLSEWDAVHELGQSQPLRFRRGEKVAPAAERSAALGAFGRSLDDADTDTLAIPMRQLYPVYSSARSPIAAAISRAMPRQYSVVGTKLISSGVAKSGSVWHA